LTWNPRDQKVLIVAVAVLIFVLGYGISWWTNVKVPRDQRTAIAREELDIKDRTRRGTVEEVAPDKITIKLTFASDRRLIGETETYDVNFLTNVMVGPDFINEPSVDPDIVRYFEVGDLVEIIQSKQEKTRAVVLRRELREGERPVFSLSDPMSNIERGGIP
jgi:hypothetical protein